LWADDPAGGSSIDPPAVRKNDQSMEKKGEGISLRILAAYSTLLSFGSTVNRSAVK
jgi:hypothetical protein